MRGHDGRLDACGFEITLPAGPGLDLAIDWKQIGRDAPLAIDTDVMS